MPCKRILFVVDTPEGFPPAVLKKVARVGIGLDAEVEVFDTTFDPTVFDGRKVHEAIERRHSDLDPLVDVLQGFSARAHARVRWAHPPRHGIEDEIRDYQPDLVIIRGRKHTHLERMLFSYSDYKLIENAPCPILIIKNERPYADTRVIAAIDPMHLHDKPAQLDEAILEAAASAAAALKLPLHVYHACALFPPMAEKARIRVNLLAEAAGVAEQRVHIEPGDPAVLLPRFVSDTPTDLLVMGAISRSWFRKALIGYTAEKVLDATDCDLLIVKPS